MNPSALQSPISNLPSAAPRKPRGMTMRRKKSLIRRILAEKEKASALYSRIDALTEELRHGVEVDREVIELDPLTRYQVIDNFAQLSAGKYARINRFELKKLPQTKRPSKETAAQPEEDQLP